MLNSIIKTIDALIDWQGKISSFLIYPLVGIVLYEVIMRYVFNAPTIWGFEATGFVYGMHFMLGLSFMERYGGHVRVDILSARLPEKGQAALGALTYLMIFLPVYSIMTWAAFRFAYTATMNHELNSTSWAPPIWPFKIIMAICFLFLALQGFCTFLRHIRTLTGGREPSSTR